MYNKIYIHISKLALYFYLFCKYMAYGRGWYRQSRLGLARTRRQLKRYESLRMSMVMGYRASETPRARLEPRLFFRFKISLRNDCQLGCYDLTSRLA